MKLDGLALLRDISDDHGAGLLIGADQITDEKIPALEAFTVFVRCDTDMKRPVSQFALITAQGLIDVLEALQGRHAAQFMNEILFRLRDDIALSDRTTTLGHHGLNRNPTGQGDSDQSRVIEGLVQHEPILTDIPSSSGQPPDGDRARVSIFEQRQDLLHGSREGVGEEQQHRGGVKTVMECVRPSGHGELVVQA